MKMSSCLWNAVAYPSGLLQSSTRKSKLFELFIEHRSLIYMNLDNLILFRVKAGAKEHDCLVISGSLTDGAKQFAVAVVTTKLPSTIEVLHYV